MSKEGLGVPGVLKGWSLQVVGEPSLVQEADGALTTKRTPPELGGPGAMAVHGPEHGWERGNSGPRDPILPGSWDNRHQVAKSVPISAISLGPGWRPAV